MTKPTTGAGGGGAEDSAESADFIRTIIEEDLRTGKHDGRVVTRFPPEPNGFLHIGHAKAICLNFGVAEQYGGICNLRMDDTDPAKEDVAYVEAIKRDVRWLGFDWDDRMYYASDYFEQLYQHAEGLIKDGKAYVCSLSEEQMREHRGTITEPGRESPYRQRSAAENLDLFRRMRAGEFADGAHVLRARIDMAATNMKMRDPAIYRIRHAAHYRTGDEWCIYPLYDFTHCLSDSIEGITHSLCTLEFENNRELYDWVLDHTEVDCHPQQIEFARLALTYTVLSKRKLLLLVTQQVVQGWDDPRMPTLAGLRRRGYPPRAIRSFCDRIGIAKHNSTVDIALLEHAVREELNQVAPRVLCVLKPLRVVIDTYPEDRTEELTAPYFPHDVPQEGSRQLPFSRVLYLERDDFREDPPKKWHRLAPGREVRLRYSYIIKCHEVIKDPASGEIVELRCSHDPDTLNAPPKDGRKVRGTLHWVSAATAVSAEVRLYDRLFTVEKPGAGDEDFRAHLNPRSLEIIEGLIEPSAAAAEPGSHFQFERHGYFCVDQASPRDGKPVFNRTVPLRDSWAKIDGAQPAPAEPPAKEAAPEPAAPPAKAAAAGGPAAAGPPPRAELTAVQQRLRDAYGLSEADARLAGKDEATAAFFEAAVAEHDNPKGIANWINNELMRELKDGSVAALPFGPGHLAELVALLDEATISSKIAKEVLLLMLAGGERPRDIVKRRGFEQVTDAGELARIVADVIAANPDAVGRYRGGKQGTLGFFVGQVMKRTGGKANPKLVNELLLAKLAETERQG